MKESIDANYIKLIDSIIELTMSLLIFCLLDLSILSESGTNVSNYGSGLIYFSL